MTFQDARANEFSDNHVEIARDIDVRHKSVILCGISRIVESRLRRIDYR